MGKESLGDFRLSWKDASLKSFRFLAIAFLLSGTDVPHVLATAALVIERVQRVVCRVKPPAHGHASLEALLARSGVDRPCAASPREHVRGEGEGRHPRTP